MDKHSFYTKSILKAQIYIQENLGEELSLEKIAKVAGFSPYHFHRIFHAVTKESLNDYVRRIRVEKAARHLKFLKKSSITCVALDSGYKTPSAFTRAFKKLIGKSPKEFRGESKKCDALQKQSIRKEETMQTPEILTMDAIPVLFVRETGSYYDTPKKAWESLSLVIKKYPDTLGKARRFGIALDDPTITEEAKIRFDACVEETEKHISDNHVGRQIIPGGKYAVFTHVGRYQELSKTYDMIFGQWYPKYKDSLVDATTFVEYLNMEKLFTNPDELVTKIYLALK